MSSVSRAIRSSRAGYDRAGYSKYSRNLSLAGSRSPKNASRYSRFSNGSAYANQRRKRARRKQILITVLVAFMALLVAGGAAVFAFVQDMNGRLKNPEVDTVNPLLKQPNAPSDPFWMLLVGKDYEDEGLSRADTIILAYINPGAKQAALVSIPRDAYVAIPGFWTDKINAAYAYGTLYDGHTGPELLTRTVLEFAGVDIAGYVEIGIDGLWEVVNALGGVVVDVPVDIIGDREAGAVDVYAGEQQRLNGDEALVFIRSRQYAIADYQRQANQRTFLQALAKQVLSADVFTMANTITKICDITTTTFKLSDIVRVATGMRGMVESDIYTYSIPCASERTDGIWYEIPDLETTRALFAAISSGTFPDPDEWNLTRQGEIPDNYRPKSTSSGSSDTNPGSSFNTSAYTVDVRNGYGIQGAATAASDFLALAGYIQGEISNTGTFAYTETLIIYPDETRRAVAEDILMRLDYGRIIPSLGRYSFEGDVLVIVGGDYKP